MNVMKQAHDMARHLIADGHYGFYRDALRFALRKFHALAKRVMRIASVMTESVIKRCPWLDAESLMPKAMEDCTRIAKEHGVELLEKQFRYGI